MSEKKLSFGAIAATFAKKAVDSFEVPEDMDEEIKGIVNHVKEWCDFARLDHSCVMLNFWSF